MSSNKMKHRKISCNICDFTCRDLDEIKIHNSLKHGKKCYKCKHCNRYYSYLQNLKRHLRTSNCMHQFSHKKLKLKNENMEILSDDDSGATPESKKYLCTLCMKTFTRCDDFKMHQASFCRVRRVKKYGLPSTYKPKSFTHILKHLKDCEEVVTLETAFKSRLMTYGLINKDAIHNPIEYLNSKAKIVKYLISKELQSKQCVKVNVMFEVEHTNLIGETQIKNFKTTNIPIYQQDDLDLYVRSAYDKLQQELSEFQGKKSGWAVYKVHGLELRINKYCPLKGYRYIKLPKEIAARTAVVNVKNKDNKCFQYSILTKNLTCKDKNRPWSYKHLKHKYNFSCVSSPTELREIPTFERTNNISINVFGIGENDKIYPMKITNDLPDHRDLLFVKDKLGGHHYCYIKNFERLVGPQITKRKGKKFICKRCFTFYYRDRNGLERLKAHKILCETKREARVEMPKSDEAKITFTNVERSLRLPIVLYADFECMLKKISNCKPAPNQSSTTKLQSHELLSFCVYAKTCNLNEKEINMLPKEPYIYRKKSDDDDVGAEFVKYINKISNIVKIIYAKYDPMFPLTRREKYEFKLAEECYLCHKPFTRKNYKVRDHSHATGEYRGAAHNICNLNNRKPRTLPIFFHNLAYDSHFIIPKLTTVPGQVQVIPNTEEKYISFTKFNGNIKCRFLDSYRFMSSSISKLATILPRDEFKETLKHTNFSDEHFELLLRKGVYCYDYTDSLEKLNVTKLPSREKFYSILTESSISEEDYNHAKKVWKTFKIKDLGEYSDLYMKNDVLILADIFEHFRTLCLKHYNLDPSYYYTAPGLTWDAALKFTKMTLELLVDYDMLLMFEEGIRGGITQCVKRHAVANNSYLDDYNPDLLTTFLCFLDANNLYGKAMCEPLPYGGFEWVDVSKIKICSIMDLDDEGEYGYVFEFDIDYPVSLHDLHSDLPFLPVHEVPAGSKFSKLLTTLNNKEKYVAHYKFIKQAMAYGLQVTKLHRGIRFLQSRWLAPYIKLNTELRRDAKNEFELDFFKLMNNSFYGKTVENIRNRLNMKIVVTEKQLQNMINKCSFLDRTIFAEQVVAVHMAKEVIRMSKPIYVGMCILDLSKIIMYEFYYGVLKKRYGSKIQLMYMDTDSYLILVETPDFYEDMKDMSVHLDLSCYPKNHPAGCYSKRNKKRLGKFKDETNGTPIKQFCGLRPKMYCVEVDDTFKKKIKGVKSYAVKIKVSMEDFLKCLYSNEISHVSYRNITTKLHNVYTVESSKVALSPHDDKRVILWDGISTLPYGHIKLRPLPTYISDLEMDWSSDSD